MFDSCVFFILLLVMNSDPRLRPRARDPEDVPGTRRTVLQDATPLGRGGGEVPRAATQGGCERGGGDRGLAEEPVKTRVITSYARKENNKNNESSS